MKVYNYYFRALASLYDMDFGKGLMPGEGVAMAEFVANGQVRN